MMHTARSQTTPTAIAMRESPNRTMPTELKTRRRADAAAPQSPKLRRTPPPQASVMADGVMLICGLARCCSSNNGHLRGSECGEFCEGEGDEAGEAGPLDHVEAVEERLRLDEID